MLNVDYTQARALLGVNPFTLEIKALDGPYDSAPVSAPFHGELPKVSGDNLKLYTGGCYCGAVTLAVKLKPLSEVEIKEDNCSICQRNANICMYPHRDSVSIHGSENTSEYLFQRKFNGHCFCQVCGVQLYMILHGPPKAVVDNLPAEKQEMVQEMLAIVPIRLAVLDGVEWSECHIKRSDEGTAGYAV
ncbi:hypothetical protein N7507_000343 [Penicillium longicatenatum]|nr:hypothetical protein N7507_000343 [Penicillium longicatenatum]